MQFSDFRFPESAAEFPPAEVVQQYLNAFVEYAQLRPYIWLNTQVLLVYDRKLSEQLQWILVARDVKKGQVYVEEFDAICVCNGHYSLPVIPSLPGTSQTCCRVLHSHSYRSPSSFKGRRVLVVGGSHSGIDIAHELVPFAESVTLSMKSEDRYQVLEQFVLQLIQGAGKPVYADKIKKCPEVVRFSGQNQVVFSNATVAEFDAVIFATGYDYHFPFLPERILSAPRDKRVHPLYKHLFHASYPCGSLSFIGIPWRVVPFPLCEVQARWVAKVLKGKVKLPSSAAMLADIQLHYKQLEENNLPMAMAHMLVNSGFDYLTSINMNDPEDAFSYQISPETRTVRRKRNHTNRGNSVVGRSRL